MTPLAIHPGMQLLLPMDVNSEKLDLGQLVNPTALALVKEDDLKRNIQRTEDIAHIKFPKIRFLG